MRAVNFDKKRTFDAPAAEWAAFASGLQYRRIVQFHAAMHGDTERLDTNLDVWPVRSGGKLYTFDFGRIVDSRVRPIVKWLMFKFL